MCFCVWGSRPRLPGCAFRLLMLSTFAKIAQGMLAYSRFSESPSCFRGKPCGKHALNPTRCCMYNATYFRSYRPVNILTLTWCTSEHAQWATWDLKQMRLIRMITGDEDRWGGGGMIGNNSPNQSDWGYFLDFVSNKMGGEALVSVRARASVMVRKWLKRETPHRYAAWSAWRVSLDVQLILSQQRGEISLWLPGLAPTAIIISDLLDREGN